MSRRFVPIAILTLALLARAPVHAQNPLYDLFGSYLDTLRTQVGIPGLAAAIVDGGAVAWERGFGRQDVERALAARADTPFHVDGLTQVFTATQVLRCVEEGRLSLEDRVSRFSPNSRFASATLGEILTHTERAGGSLTFAYRPERLEPLGAVVRACTTDSYRETLANQLHRLAMIDSVPGPDVVTLAPPAEGIPDPAEVAQYTRALTRLATPYAVDAQKRAAVSQYAATTLTPGGGLISSVHDLAQFDLALKRGLLVRPETLEQAWRAPTGSDGLPLPHAVGWFSTTYNGVHFVWQFGVSENAGSAMILTAPARGLTLILVANSTGLVRPFPLASGDLQSSPFARLFLKLFV